MKNHTPGPPPSSAPRTSARSAVRGAGRGLSFGFALMALAPWLAAVLLLDRSGAIEREILFGFEGLVILLMIGSAFAGYAYVRHELGRTLSSILTEARRAALVDQSRRSNASADELSRISEALARIDERLEAGGAGPASAGAPSGSVAARLDLGGVVEGLLIEDQSTGLSKVLKEAIRGLAANSAYLVVPDEARGEFVTWAVAGAGNAGLVGQRAPLGEGVPAAAARERTPLLLSNPERAETPGSGALADPSPDVMAVPLFSRETLRGVLVVQEPLREGGFRDEDLRELAGLARLVVAAMDRASSQGTPESGGSDDDRVDETLRMFARAIDERNPYTRGHSERVARYCEEMSKSLRFDEESVRLVRRAALLHDVGKLLLPDSIVRKDGRLNDEELDLMRSHVAKVETMVRRVACLAGIAPLVRHHHERCDGTGYPDGARGDDLPLAAHVLIVANAFDIMTSDRSYRQAASLLHALRVLQEEAGTKYDRRAVQALCGLDRNVLTAPTDLPVNLGSTVKGQGSASISILD